MTKLGSVWALVVVAVIGASATTWAATSATPAATAMVAAAATPDFTWDLADDFRDAPNQANPSPDSYGNRNVWDYSSGSVTPGDLIPNFSSEPCGSATIDGWEGPTGLPYVFHNGSDVATDCFAGSELDPNGIMAHPGGTGIPPLRIGWTSPYTGVVAISGAVTDTNPSCGFDGLTWSVTVKGTTVSFGAASATTSTLAQGTVEGDLDAVPVSVGDRIELVLDPNGETNCDATLVDLSIALTLPDPDDQVWDLADDFRDAPNQANPSPDSYGNADVWDYRSGSTAPGSLMDDFTFDTLASCGNATIQGWRDTPGVTGLPYVLHNSSDVPATCVTPPLPANEILVHPASGSAVRIGWTSPFTGTAAISGTVTDNDADCGGGVTWTVSNAGTAVASGAAFNTTMTLDAGADPNNLDALAVTAGSRIELAIDPGASFECDATRVEFTIARIVEVPEPGPEPDTSIDSGPGLTNTSTPTFGFSSDIGTSFECKVDGAGETSAAFETCTSPFTVDTLTDGSYVFSVRAIAAGATDATPATRSVTVDTVGPATTVLTGPQGTTTTTTAAFTYSTESDAAVACKLDGPGATTRALAPCPPTPTYGPLDLGTYTFTVQATDAAGNAGTAATRSFTVVSPAPPPSTLTVLKTVNRASAKPNQVVTYKVKVTNTGPTSKKFTVVDDLRGVIDDAAIRKVTAPRGTSASLRSAQLTWTGTLAKGKSVTLTYTAQVRTVGLLFFGDRQLVNTVTAANSTCPASAPVGPGPCTTSTPVMIPPPRGRR